MTTLPEDDMTELVDADFPRVDLVGKGANGVPRFLIAKQDEGGLLDPEFVRDLIGKQADEPDTGRERAVMPNGITVSGSPADIAAFIHKASVRQAEETTEVAKEKYSAEDKRRMLAAGHAIKNEDGDPAYPIGDKDDLGKAIRAVGRGGPDHDQIRAYITRRAKALGASSEIPDDWASDGSLKEKVSKDMAGTGPELDDGVDGMDLTVPLAAPEDDAPGDPADPGSPAWESIDAATARQWTTIFARGQNALSVLAEREMLEAASADPDDACNAMDLQDAMCALDYVIGILAPFAVGEQSEADCGAAEMAAIGKVAAEAGAPLDVIEGLTAVRKSGRVLSAANEAHIRDAAAALNTVLSSLPKAPTADDGQPVAKEGTTVDDTTDVAKTASPDEQARDTGPVQAGGTTGMGEPRTAGPASALPGDGPQAALPGDVPGRQVIKSALTLVYTRDRELAGVTDTSAIMTRVAKADGDGEKKAMQAVFDQDGDLIGIVDPDAIQPVTGAGGKPAADDGADGAADDTDMTPQPPAEAGTPADAVADDGTVTKQDASGSTSGSVTLDVLKSVIADAVRQELGTGRQAEDIAKGAVAPLLEEVEALKARVAVVEESPAAPKVFTSGQVPPAHQMRGQGHGAPQIDVTKAAELKREMYTADPARANQIAHELNRSAIAGLEAIHAAGRQ